MAADQAPPNPQPHGGKAGNLPTPAPGSRVACPVRPAPSGWRKWLFRLGALSVVPALLLSLLELGLRLAGFGYPTTLFLDFTVEGQQVCEVNDRFCLLFPSRPGP